MSAPTERLVTTITRTNYPWLGPLDTRIFPHMDPAQDLHWYRRQPAAIRNEARRWNHFINDVLDVTSSRDIPTLFGASESVKQHIGERLREGVALYHRINLIDQPSTSGIRPLVLEDTRDNEQISKTTAEMDKLIAEGIKEAIGVYGYLTNPHNGVLKDFNSILPRPVNEPPGWNDPVDLLLACYSDKWTDRTKYELRTLLALGLGPIIEIKLHQERYEGVKDKLFKMLGKQIFLPEIHGPLARLHYTTTHADEDWSVKAVHILFPDEKYELDPKHPNTVYHSSDVRLWRDLNGEVHPVLFEDNDKSIASAVLKMVKKNLVDPQDLHDTYRMSATFVERGDIDKFYATLIAKGKASGINISIEIEENALDGKPYEALDNGEVGLHAGVSQKYQVLRLRLEMQNGGSPVRMELSCYTLEAATNDMRRDGVGKKEYLLNRLIQPDRRTGAPLASFLFPPDVVGVDVVQAAGSAIQSVRAGNRYEVYNPNDRMAHFYRPFDPDTDKRHALKAFRQFLEIWDEYPQIIIAVGPNALSSARTLASYYGAGVVFFDPPNGHYEDEVRRFTQSHTNIFKGKNIFILDDIGDQARYSKLLKGHLQGSKVGFLALKENSEAEAIADVAGIIVKNDEYIVFPHQRTETIVGAEGAMALITRRSGNGHELLILEEKNGQFKLPGGRLQERLDDNPMDTLRRTLGTELGDEAKIQILQTKKEINPIKTQMQISNRLPNVPANQIQLYGYMINGTEIELETIKIPENSQIQALHWITLEAAEEILKNHGHQALIAQYRQWLEDGRNQRRIFGSPLETLIFHQSVNLAELIGNS